MVADFIFSINAVLPIFLVMLFGIFLKGIRMIDNNGARQMNAILFNFALPVRLFLDVVSSDFTQLLDGQLIIFAMASTVLWFFICWGCAVFFVSERKVRGAFVQASFRSNYAIMGIPLINSIMGYTVSKAAVITTFVIPIFNILSVLILTIYSGEEISIKATVSSAAKNVVKNPIIIGIFIGILFSIIRIPIPTAIGKSLNYLADLSTPLALVSIGASMNFAKVRERLKPTLVVTFLKLVAMPVLFVSIALIIGMTAENIVILFVMYAAPTAVSSYVMAVYMGSDEHLASNAILSTSLLSVVTCTIGVYLIKSFGII